MKCTEIEPKKCMTDAAEENSVDCYKRKRNIVEAEKNHYNRYSNIRTAFLKTRGRNIDVKQEGEKPRQEF